MSFTLFLVATFGLILLIIGYRIVFKKTFYFTSVYSETRTLPSTSGDFETKIPEALKKCDFKAVRFDHSKYKAWARFSLWSWGERIEVDYNQSNDDFVKVNCTSTCYFPMQIFDWGKNKQNTIDFFKKLELLNR